MFILTKNQVWQGNVNLCHLTNFLGNQIVGAFLKARISHGRSVNGAVQHRTIGSAKN
jgi:hypothetical protein